MAKIIRVISLDELWESGETLTLTLDYRLATPSAAYRFGMCGGICALDGKLDEFLGAYYDTYAF